MQRRTFASLSISLGLTAFAGTTTWFATSSSPAPDRSPLHAPALLSAQPAHFVRNDGQWADPVRFRARFGRGTVFLEDAGWTIALFNGREQGASLRMRLLGAATDPELVPAEPRAGRHGYFTGSDSSAWRADVPLYGSVRYREVYPGVDLRTYEKERHFEYDLLLQPGADLEQVEIGVEGARTLALDDRGALVIETAAGTVTQPAPVTWQTDATGATHEVACHYRLLDGARFGFAAEGRDAELPLTVDPGLVWSTLTGEIDAGAVTGLSVDAAGVVTIVGSTTSANYPTTTGAYSTTKGPAEEAFVTQLDPSQSGAAQLVYSTFLGGSGDDRAQAVSVAANGVITVAGSTTSASFPTTPGAYATSGSGNVDAFVSKLDPQLAGNAQLVYSTLLGGSDQDDPAALHVGSSGDITVTGTTVSSDWPTTTGAFDTTYAGASTVGGGGDVFVARLDPALTGNAQLAWSTFLGASESEWGADLSIDAGGLVTVTGSTQSTGFPTTAGAYGTALNGASAAFVATLDPTLSGNAQLVYGTYVGGQGWDRGHAVAVDATGQITIGGTASSFDFPTTAGAFSTNRGGGSFEGDGFITRLDPSETGSAQLSYSTYFGGTDDDSIRDIHVDPSGNGLVTVVGSTLSFFYFPTTDGALYTQPQNSYGLEDAFVAQLNINRVGAAQLVYSTYFGSWLHDTARAVHVDDRGFVTIAGDTISPNFPTTPGAYRSVYPNNTEGFVSRLDMLPEGVTAYGASSPGCAGTLVASVTSWPQVGNTAFSLTCTNAPTPASALGWLMLSGSALTTPVSLLGVDVWVNPSPVLVTLPATNSSQGFSEVPLPLPGIPALVNQSFVAQFVWADPTTGPTCPTLGLSASQALDITVLP